MKPQYFINEMFLFLPSCYEIMSIVLNIIDNQRE